MSPEHRIWLGWYEGGKARCAKCGEEIEPLGIRRNVVTGWRHAAKLRTTRP